MFTFFIIFTPGDLEMLLFWLKGWKTNQNLLVFSLFFLQFFMNCVWTCVYFYTYENQTGASWCGKTTLQVITFTSIPIKIDVCLLPWCCVCRCVVFLLISPALSSHPLSSPVIPPVAMVTASGRQTHPCHVGRLWCWSVLMETALSLFVHLKHSHVTAPPGKGNSYRHFTSILLIILWGLASSCFYICSLYVQYFSINKSCQFHKEWQKIGLLSRWFTLSK